MLLQSNWTTWVGLITLSCIIFLQATTKPERESIMKVSENGTDLYSQQHETAKPLFHRFTNLVKVIHQSDPDTLHGLHDWLQVELMIGHIGDPERQFYRAAFDFCSAQIKQKEKAVSPAPPGRIKARLRLAANRMSTLFGD